MLKRFSCILFFLLIFPIYVSAGSIDLPYYMGFVNTDGSTTIKDGSWAETNKSVHMKTPADNHFYNSPGDGRLVKSLTNGAVAVIYWWYNGVDTWTLDDAQIFRVNQDTVVYYGDYSFEASEYEAFDHPQRFPRELKTGESLTLNLSTGGGTDTWSTIITLQREGITFPAAATPGGSNLTNCALLHFCDDCESSSDWEISTEIWAPNVGPVWATCLESEEGGTEYWSEMQDEITSWGTGSSQPYMQATGSGSTGVEYALGILNGLTLSTNIVDVKPTSNTKVIVIPMN